MDGGQDPNLIPRQSATAPAFGALKKIYERFTDKVHTRSSRRGGWVEAFSVCREINLLDTGRVWSLCVSLVTEGSVNKTKSV